MKHSVIVATLSLVLTVCWFAQPSRAASTALPVSPSAMVTSSSNHNATQLKKDEVKPPKDKDKKSKKNDGKDNDDDDGNAGGGNDNKDKDKDKN